LSQPVHTLQLSEEAVLEFIKIYRDECGVELSYEQGQEKAKSIASLYQFLIFKN